jgi:hypothetical protein
VLLQSFVENMNLTAVCPIPCTAVAWMAYSTVWHSVQLRQSNTDEENEAFLWFIGDFIASVVGTKVWGRKKFYHRVSEAVIDKGGQDLVVTISDEAFAILIYENYIDKWIAKFHMEQQGEKAIGMIKGKYTSSVNDKCLYHGG